MSKRKETKSKTVPTLTSEVEVRTAPVRKGRTGASEVVRVPRQRNATKRRPPTVKACIVGASVSPVCLDCGKRLRQPKRGRPRKFCSSQCRLRGYRAAEREGAGKRQSTSVTDSLEAGALRAQLSAALERAAAAERTAVEQAAAHPTDKFTKREIARYQRELTEAKAGRARLENDLADRRLQGHQLAAAVSRAEVAEQRLAALWAKEGPRDSAQLSDDPQAALGRALERVATLESELATLRFDSLGRFRRTREEHTAALARAHAEGALQAALTQRASKPAGVTGVDPFELKAANDAWQFERSRADASHERFAEALKAVDRLKAERETHRREVQELHLRILELENSS